MANKFKVGDVVKAIDNYYVCTTLNNDWQGVVTKVDAYVDEFSAETTFVKTKEHSHGVKIGESFSRLEPKHFELVTPKPKKLERIANAEQAIAEFRAELDAVKAQLAESQAEAEDAVKAGDFVLNIGDDCDFLTIGKVYEVINIDCDGDYQVIDDDGDASYIATHHCEKVAKPSAAQAKQTQYKVGDVVIIDREVRVIVFVSEGRYRYRNVLVGDVGEELAPQCTSESFVERYATAEEIANVGK